MNTAHVHDFLSWRKQARRLLIAGVPPSLVNWSDENQTALPLEVAPERAQALQPNRGIRVPKAFLRIARAASCYRDPRRWPLLYSILWRMTHGAPHLLNLHSDRQVRELNMMAKAVGRDAHKMHAFVRFRKTTGFNGAAEGEEHFIAWFEPGHLIVEYNANFFVKRFTNMNWSILTPDRCAHWNQKDLYFSEGTDRSAAVSDDSMEDYWRKYYASIFNPARLKEQAMRSEMPKKYWKHLPEASLIPELTKASTQRMDKMLQPDEPEVI